MTTAVQTSALPEHLRFDENTTENIVEVPDDKKFRAVVFIGDLLTQQHKQSEMYRIGGRLYPESLTVPNRFVARCAITPLREGMLSIYYMLIAEDQRKNYIAAYKKKNVLLDPKTGKRGDVVIGKSEGTRHLLFKKVFPAQEIGAIAHQNDGVVEITALNNAQEVLEAQFHYFPDWTRIVSGRVPLPSRMAELREFIENRRAKTNSAAIIAVGDAYIQSCEQYAIWGKQYVDQQTAAIEDSKTVRGFTQRYDEISERLFTYLDLTRKDSFVEDFARNAVNGGGGGDSDIKTAITLLTQLVAKNQGIEIGDTKPPVEVPPVETGLSGEQAYDEALNDEEIEEIPNEDETADGDEITLDEDDADDNAPPTEEEIRTGKCSDLNSKQEQCGGGVVKRVNGKLYCKYHPKEPA